MIGDILLEVAKAIGRFFINPLLYIALGFAVFLGYRRVKRERKHFHTRILGGLSEFTTILGGVRASLVISVLILAVGLTLPIDFLLFVVVLTVIGLILYNFHLLSPIILMTVAFGALVAMNYFDVAFTLWNHTYAGFSLDSGFAVSIAAIAGMLLIVEAHIINRDGEQFASPLIEKANRGLACAAYFFKKITIVPLFLIIPGSVIDSYAPWWPQITLGDVQFALVIFPIVIGVQQKARKTLPVTFYPALSRAVLKLGVFTIIIAIASYFEPYVALIGLPLAAIIRLFISVNMASKEKAHLHAVAPTERGVMIVAVLPHSPAEKMGLQIGEVIKSVNGQLVHNARELYEALQINAAHCRLEVLDHQNELRLTQHVVHNNDNHKIGVITLDN